MNEDAVSPPEKNKFADLAWGATVVNLISWLSLAIPGFLQSGWSLIILVTIPLSTILALIAGVLGLRKPKASSKEVGQSCAGLLVGALSLLMIVLGIIGIYAMVNAPF